MHIWGEEPLREEFGRVPPPEQAPGPVLRGQDRAMIPSPEDLIDVSVSKSVPMC